MESQKKTTMEALRATGRTTRMLERAVELAKKGNRVCVVVANSSQVPIVFKEIENLDENFMRRQIIVRSVSDSFDWNIYRFPSEHPSVIHLVDHYAIESRYAGLISMLHAFDPPAVVVVPDQKPVFSMEPFFPEQKPASEINPSGAKYFRKVKLTEGKADVYAVLNAFDVKCPARQHAVKKLLLSGLRGKGDTMQDLSEARDAVTRAIQLEAN